MNNKELFFSKSYEGHTVITLRNICREEGLKVSGIKKELYERLINHFNNKQDTIVKLMKDFNIFDNKISELEKLPNEILLNIISNLDIKSLEKFCATNKTFYKKCEGLYKKYPNFFKKMFAIFTEKEFKMLLNKLYIKTNYFDQLYNFFNKLSIRIIKSIEKKGINNFFNSDMYYISSIRDAEPPSFFKNTSFSPLHLYILEKMISNILLSMASKMTMKVNVVSNDGMGVEIFPYMIKGIRINLHKTPENPMFRNTVAESYDFVFDNTARMLSNNDIVNIIYNHHLVDRAKMEIFDVLKQNLDTIEEGKLLIINDIKWNDIN